jgi:hypothetical protein
MEIGMEQSDSSENLSEMLYNIGTAHCTVRYDLVQKFKDVYGNRFDDLNFLNLKTGQFVKGSVISDARSGCEINDRLGWEVTGPRRYNCSCPVDVTRVGGPKDCVMEGSAEYRVTGYNKPATAADKGRIKWKIDVYCRNGTLLESIEDGKRPDLKTIHSETMILKPIPGKWSNCTLKVTAYIKTINPQSFAQTTVKFKPFLLAESDRKPRVGYDGVSLADDMKYNDYSESYYRSITWMCKHDPLLTASDSDLFANMRVLAFSTSVGDLGRNISKMIDKFESGTGGEYSDAGLTEMVRNHKAIIKFIQGVKDKFNDLLRKKTDIKSSDRIPEYRLPHPKFDGYTTNLLNGLKIAINDVWAYTVELVNFEMISTSSYNFGIKITLFDHFGLDKPDLEKFSGLAGFRAWFILQHIRGYKPFVTKIEFKTQNSNTF